MDGRYGLRDARFVIGSSLIPLIFVYLVSHSIFFSMQASASMSAASRLMSQRCQALLAQFSTESVSLHSWATTTSATATDLSRATSAPQSWWTPLLVASTSRVMHYQGNFVHTAVKLTRRINASWCRDVC
jgi:hypothetical protein